MAAEGWVRLVLLETVGNQRYIFDTNKRRENVGASDLLYRIGTDWVLDTVDEARSKSGWTGPPFDKKAHHLTDPRVNPPFENGNPIEVVVAASGKAVLIVRSESVGKEVVRRVTSRALKEAPGAGVYGVVGDSFELGVGIGAQVKTIHRQHEQLRGSVPDASARFPRLPVVAPCTRSGLPAAEVVGLGPEAEVLSRVSKAKSDNRDQGARIRTLVEEDGLRLIDDPDDMETVEWVAVIHADGNDLGQIFLGFENYARDDRSYVDKLRRFSLALDRCTCDAFKAALRQTVRERRIRPGEKLKVIPLVLGGDDLTVVCEGGLALALAVSFLENFTAQTKQGDVWNIIGQHLTASAGIAIVKPHYPFHAAYALAEDLLKSAKRLKPDSAVDFHVHYDASGSDLDRIRAKLRVDGGRTQLFARPYVVGTADTEWQTWQSLEQGLSWIPKRVRPEPGQVRPPPPKTVLHSLREALFLGQQIADTRFGALRHRYRGWEKITGNRDGSLFIDVRGQRGIDKGVERVTRLTDLMDLTTFW